MATRWRPVLQTLGLRVTMWYAGIFLASVAAVGVLAYWLLVAGLESRDHEMLEVKLAEYADRYESGGLQAVSRSVSAEQTSGSADLVLVRVVGPNADLRFFSVPPAWRNFDLTQLDQAPRSPSMRQLVPSSTTPATLEVMSRPLSDGAILQVGRTTFARDQFLDEVSHLLGVIVGAVVLAGLAGGAALTLSALRPLRELRDTVRHIAETGQFGERVKTRTSGDLVDDLGHEFNQVFGRIETLVNGMRGALDNVAHELRTPVARLRARAESALSSHGADEASTREALAECLEEADQVAALLSTLMDISEAETGTMPLSLESVAVGDAVRDTLDLYEDTAEDRGVALRAQAADHLVVRADRQRLRQVLANLVDNALKYTPSGGEVVVSARRDGGDVEISVTDTGIGIADADVPRIWDRLYRGQAPPEARGLGLGLSLVRAIVRAHGGTVGVTSTLGRGSTFQLRLPAELIPTEKV